LEHLQDFESSEQAMKAHAQIPGSSRVLKIRQAIKWTVYGLLLVNFVFYIVEDVTRAAYTLHAGSTILEWTSAFATSFDLLGWFLLLLMFELETYALEDDSWTGKVPLIVHSVRIFCFVLIAHTVFAFFNTVQDLGATIELEGVSSLCELANDELSFVYSLEYVDITPENCGEISNDPPFFKVGVDPVVSSAEGLQLERDLALADLAEVLLWLVVIFAIEVIVRLQGKNITEGPWIRSLTWVKMLGYTVLMGLGIYWASLSHWLYLWDMILWIGGFAAIEMNISEWRDEIREDEELHPQQDVAAMES
jgi:hypothetical protein